MWEIRRKSRREINVRRHSQYVVVDAAQGRVKRAEVGRTPHRNSCCYFRDYCGVLICCESIILTSLGTFAKL